MKASTTITVAALIAAALLAVSPALANPAIGTNPDLLPGGEIYIPFSPEASGTLGQSLGGGDFVGKQSDSATVSFFNPTSSGFVTFEMLFDITADLGPSPEIDPLSAMLALTFDDLDFKTVHYNKHDFRESLTIEFLRDAGGTPTGTPLIIDNTNYDNPVFGAGPIGFETDNEIREYEVGFQSMLGLTEDDFTDMETDKNFALRVTMRSYLTYTDGLFSWATSTNTSENIGNSFAVVGVPEPGTLALIAIGAVGLLRRRRTA